MNSLFADGHVSAYTGFTTYNSHDANWFGVTDGYNITKGYDKPE